MIRPKTLFKLLTGQFSHLKKTLHIKSKWYGSNYGGFFVHPNLLTKDSIVYSFGIGEDISFDLAIIEKHNCKVFGFDPTPKSINWIKKQSISPNFTFFDYGIADKSEAIDFYLPKNPAHVSGSFIKQKNINDQEKVMVQMKTLEDITLNLGHKRIDVLKMDIEGAEYQVIDNILRTKIEIDQILIEFHDRFFENGINKTIEVINKLKHHGFELFNVSDTFEEISFINTKCL